MPPRRAVELRVGGQTYRVVASDNDQQVQHLADLVDRKFAEIVPPGRGMTPHQAMFLVAMAFADEAEEQRLRAAKLEGERDRSKDLAVRARDVVARLLERVDGALAAFPAQVSKPEREPRALSAAEGALLTDVAQADVFPANTHPTGSRANAHAANSRANAHAANSPANADFLDSPADADLLDSPADADLLDSPADADLTGPSAGADSTVSPEDAAGSPEEDDFLIDLLPPPDPDNAGNAHGAGPRGAGPRGPGQARDTPIDDSARWGKGAPWTKSAPAKPLTPATAATLTTPATSAKSLAQAASPAPAASPRAPVPAASPRAPVPLAARGPAAKPPTPPASLKTPAQAPPPPANAKVPATPANAKVPATPANAKVPATPAANARTAGAPARPGLRLVRRSPDDDDSR